MFNEPNGVTEGLKYNYTDIPIAGVNGLRTADIPSAYESDYVFVKKDKKLFSIRHIKGPATIQISKETFDQILSTFKFLDQEQAVDTTNSVFF
ncbi:MAG: hypothetical protein HY431_00185 [Candidatus Levybacteria bacterium]|nr:hypothetical protein [Candidatus Levybacteria bacterium]